MWELLSWMRDFILCGHHINNHHMDETKTYKWNVSHEWMNEWMDGWMDGWNNRVVVVRISLDEKVRYLPTYLPTYLLTCVPWEREPFDSSTWHVYKKVLEFSDSLV